MYIMLRSYSGEYEVVGAGRQPSSSSSERCKPTCHAMARQFISQFPMEHSDWSGVLMRLGICRPVNFYHKDDVWNSIASLYQQGRLVIYKIRRFESFKTVPIGNEKGICFIKGPKPHKRSIYAMLAINSTQDATDIVANLPSDNALLTSCLAGNGLANEFKSVGDIRKTLVEKLVNKTILAYRVPVKTMAPPQKQEELIPATGPGYDKVPLAPESKPSTAAPVERKAEPQSLGEAAQRLKDAKPAVVAAKAKGEPLPASSYTLADKQAVVENGLNERYLVRVIESGHAKDDGYIGKVREHGATISWLAPLSMVEHGDTDAEALLNAFGTRYNPTKSYTVLIIDSHKMNEVADVKTIIPTHKNLQKLIADNPHITKVDPDIAKQVLREDFVPKYSKFVKGMNAAKTNQKSTSAMEDFAKSQGFSADETNLLLKRHQLANDVSAWEEFTGNGMTLDTNVKDKTAYGPVELVMLDKSPKTLGDLKQQNAISVLAAN